MPRASPETTTQPARARSYARRLATLFPYEVARRVPIRDIIGLESAVALKNAYAMAVTLAVGLNTRWHGPDESQHYNSQAGTFTQAVRETHALMQMQGGTFESECIGLGDLYVTIFSGRTRRCGVLMGEGLNYDQVTEALAGITLESLVITRVMGQAIRRKAELGLVDLKNFPLLMHIVDILDKGAVIILESEAHRY